MAATMDGSVALLDTEAGTKLAALQPHRKYVVKALCLQAAGDTRIVTASWVRIQKPSIAPHACMHVAEQHSAVPPSRQSSTAVVRELCRTGRWRCTSSAQMATAWRR